MDSNKFPSKEGHHKWRSPANIALVKYWGKEEGQLPMNPSLSFTLSKSFTETKLSWNFIGDKHNGMELNYYFADEQNKLFEKKVKDYLLKLFDFFPFLKSLKLEFHSLNSFPHSAGIASSASSMSSIALCLCSLEKELFSKEIKLDDSFFERASFIARLGSGSGSRSIYGGVVSWGDKRNEFSEREEEIDDLFLNFCDTILIVDSSSKPLSSRAGHSLMNLHPYREARKIQAKKNYVELLSAMKKGDLKTFGEIVELEALSLHAMMITSNPFSILLKPATLSIIEAVRIFRSKTGLPVCFTIDAGPNIHLLYPKRIKKEIDLFIEEELLQYTENSDSFIDDEIGLGPCKLI